MKLVFTVPYAGHEILVVVGGGKVAGVTYDPLSTSPPWTWLSDCGRCLPGSRRVPLKVRRAVRCLATLKPASTGYDVRVSTGRKTTHVVRARRVRGEWVLTAQSRRDETLPPLKISGRGGAATPTEGRPRDYRAPVLERTLRMLLTAREATEQEVEAVLRGLPGDSTKRHSHDGEVTRLAGYQEVSLNSSAALTERVQETTLSLSGAYHLGKQAERNQVLKWLETLRGDADPRRLAAAVSTSRHYDVGEE